MTFLRRFEIVSLELEVADGDGLGRARDLAHQQLEAVRQEHGNLVVVEVVVAQAVQTVREVPNRTTKRSRVHVLLIAHRVVRLRDATKGKKSGRAE